MLCFMHHTVFSMKTNHNKKKYILRHRNILSERIAIAEYGGYPVCHSWRKSKPLTIVQATQAYNELEKLEYEVEIVEIK